MAGLLNLPKEILCEICAYLCAHCCGTIHSFPESKNTNARRPTHDLAALCRTSHHLYNVAKSYLYHFIRWTAEQTRTPPLFELTNEVITSPELVQSIRAIEYHCPNRTTLSLNDRPFEYIESSGCRPLALGEPTSLFPVSPQWHQFRNGNDTESRAKPDVLQLLLTNATNVKEMKLTLNSSMEFPPQWLLRAELFLSSLRTLHVVAGKGSHHLTIDPLLQLAPNLERLSLSGLGNPRPFPPSPAFELTNLTDLRLGGCEILGRRFLRQLIYNCARLKVFAMCFPVDEFDYDRTLPILRRYAVTLLGKRHMASLRSLCLGFDHGYPRRRFRGLYLRDFEMLERFCVTLDDIMDRDTDSKIRDIQLALAQPSSDPSEPQCQDDFLAEALPESIKELYLTDELDLFRNSHVISANMLISVNLWGLDTALRNGRFPNLQEVAISRSIWKPVANTLSVPVPPTPCSAAAERLQKLGRAWADRGGPRLIDTPPARVVYDSWH
ncbi:hypothetical protein B0T16DRAFT_455637 [Cercophora newfieldiana]|uniref:Uncharacterized protein n=1 Tax=Cercophora newfieldiana TaxID=92897 RepID=A0AA40CQY0_9PEZI|nr:hypothetical protein B0T16DRAFT_455637 [Cercophora newfieldiana]